MECGALAEFVEPGDRALVALPSLLAAGPVPVGVYPHSGTFVSPNWTFGDISPEEFAAVARGWMEQGATLIGGCCGMNPAHIDRLAQEARTWNHSMLDETR